MNDWVTDALGQFDFDSLIGLSVTQAREQVESVGGRLRALHPDGAMGLPHSPGLVTVIVDDEHVTAVVGLQGRIPNKFVPELLVKLNLDSLVGLTVREARTLVENAGGEFNVVASWNATFDVRPWRVNVQIAGGKVVEVIGRG